MNTLDWQNFREDRMRYTIIVSSSHVDFLHLVKEIAGNISVLGGGCNVVLGKGYWAEDGEETKEEYSGIKSENSATITYTDVEGQRLEIMGLVQLAANKYPNVVEWVHFEQEVVMTNHFKVK
jgi:hypothetical protein